jgi:hypothetical protein
MLIDDVKRAGILAVVCSLLSSIAIAGGTLRLGEIDPLLRQRPALRDFLESSLDLYDTVMAAVRLGPQFEHLSGARIGPYLVQGRPKRPRGGKSVEVVLCTDARFLDETGKVAADETKATRVDKKLTAVMLREVGSLPPIPACPEK